MDENEKRTDKVLFRTALSKPDLFPYLLKYEVLSHSELKRIAEEIYRLYRKTGDTVDLSIYHEQIPECEDYVGILEPVVLTEAMITRFQEIVRKKSIENTVYQIPAFHMEKEAIEISDVLKIWKDNVFEYETKIENRGNVGSAGDIYRMLIQIEEDETRRIASGYSGIDEVLGGGWRAGSTYCVMGLTGIGKSIFLTNFAGNLWKSQKQNVLYITTEMNHRQTFDRVFRSSFGCESIGEIRDILVRNKGEPLGGDNLEVIKVHPNDTTCTDIQNEIEELVWKPDVILIDYFDEIRSSERSVANEYEKHGIVAADLKKLAEVNDCPVITATQTNRSAAGEKGGTKAFVGMESIADSHKKVRTLDVLFSIIQEPYMKKENSDGGYYNLLVVKNRYGRNNKMIPFSINYASMRIDECDPKEMKAVLRNEFTEKQAKDIKSGMKKIFENRRQNTDKMTPAEKKIHTTNGRKS